MSIGDDAEIEYRNVVGREDYRVGTDGSVWSKRRNRGWRKLKTCIGRKRGNTYVRAYIGPSEGGSRFLKVARGRGRFVHQLVLEAFVGPRPVGCQACHNNGDKHDNRLLNLRWDTAAANRLDSIKLGTIGRKLTPGQAASILIAFRYGVSIRRLAKHYQVTTGAITGITHAGHWAWLKADPDVISSRPIL